LTALRGGVCDPSQIEGSGGRGIEVQARLMASTPAAEAKIAAALFPKALHDGLAKAKHVSIVPFGPVSTLPLAALKPFGDARQTVDLFTINFLLFAGEVRRPPATWSGAPKSSLIFGNPLPRDRIRAQCVTPLPFAGKEAEFVKSILGGTYLSGENATRQAFMDRAKGADALYFAAHGLAGVENGIDDSFIALADENLTARDVQRVSEFGFKTRLVVMSACQTGLGRIDEFGVIGLARTFLDAGADNTVMTLWNVDDASTATLMEAFSRNLAAHQPAEALAIAQRAVKSDPATAAPFHWAGFAVYGNRLGSR
jgi:CHAT domain-containing protein